MIQSFKNQELDNLAFDIENQQEFKELASRLGMGKQSAFIERSGSAMPYPFINTAMENQFTTLCPRKVDYKEYDKTPIPLEVMRELSFVVGENYFSKVEVWYDDKSPDPFLVGTISKSGCYYYEGGDKSKSSKFTGYDFDTQGQAKEFIEAQGHLFYFGTNDEKKYLIARWGDELRDFAELKRLALMRLKETYTGKWKMDMQALQAKLNTVEENILQFLNGEISESALGSAR
jgi:hypothetical protein